MDYPGRIIKKGEKDLEVVKLIQQQLVVKGFGPLDIDGDFGTYTETAVKDFQALSRDANGIPLLIDGKVGAITWSVLFSVPVGVPDPAYQPSAVVAKALEIAKSQSGVLEDPPGSNRGPQVEAYLKRAGCSPGDPWCASFVYWCFDEAAQALHLQNLLPRTGSCMTHWSDTKGRKTTARQATNNPSLVKPGDVFIINHGNWKGHTGMVTAVGDGYITTVEGNTNISGSREGLGVAVLKRKINSISAGFIDYSTLNG